MAARVSMMGTPATMSGMSSDVSAAVLLTESSDTVPSAKPRVRAPESPRKMLAGWKLKRRKARQEPKSAIESAAASVRPAKMEKLNIVMLAIAEMPVASPSRPSMRLMMFAKATR